MNNNVNIDAMLKEKIEKREKFDTILAYVLIVILLGCIGAVLGLKFLGKEEEKPPVDEYTPTYITIGEITTSLNNSVLANRYMNDGASFASAVNGNAMLVTYIKDGININLNIPMVGNELMINITEENSSVITEVYKEIASIICMYYGNEEKYCRHKLENIDDNCTDCIRFDNNGNTKIIYIETTKSYSIINEIVYNSVVVNDINNTDYALEMFDVKVSNINIVNSDTNISFSGNLERLNEDTSDVSVVVNLYDVNDNVLGTNKQEYNSDNVLEDTNTFEVSFLLSDTLKLEDITKYSIEIVK